MTRKNQRCTKNQAAILPLLGPVLHPCYQHAEGEVRCAPVPTWLGLLVPLRHSRPTVQCPSSPYFHVHFSCASGGSVYPTRFAPATVCPDCFPTTSHGPSGTGVITELVPLPLCPTRDPEFDASKPCRRARRGKSPHTDFSALHPSAVHTDRHGSAVPKHSSKSWSSLLDRPVFQATILLGECPTAFLL